MIDYQTGVVHIDRWHRDKKHGECIRLWEDGRKSITTLDHDRQTFQLEYDANGK